MRSVDDYQIMPWSLRLDVWVNADAVSLLSLGMQTLVGLCCHLGINTITTQ